MRMRRGAGMLLAVLLGLTLPGLARGAAIASAPAFVPTPRMFKSPVTVSITSKTAGATIYYTTDGSAPSRTKSPVYKGPVTIGATSTLKAIAFKTGLRASATTSGLYRIAAPPPPSESGGTPLPRLAHPPGRLDQLRVRLREPHPDPGPDGGGAALFVLRPHRPDHQPAHPRPGRRHPLRPRHHGASGRRLAGLADPADRHLRHGEDPLLAPRRRALPQPPHRGLPGGGDQGVLPRLERQPDLHAAAPAAGPPRRDAHRAGRRPLPLPGDLRAAAGRGRGPPAEGLLALARRAIRDAHGLPPRHLRPVAGHRRARTPTPGWCGSRSWPRPSRGPTSSASA